MNAFERYLENCGYEFDVAVNVLTGGERDETVSLRVAKEQRAEQQRGVFGFGCIFCKFLDITVQKNHCALQFVNQPSTPLTYIRAGVAFSVGTAAAVSMSAEAVHLIHAAWGLIL